jgi:hypothetical protein
MGEGRAARGRARVQAWSRRRKITTYVVAQLALGLLYAFFLLGHSRIDPPLLPLILWLGIAAGGLPSVLRPSGGDHP